MNRPNAVQISRSRASCYGDGYNTLFRIVNVTVRDTVAQKVK